MEGATLGYGREVVLRDVDLVIEPGDFLGIVGPNGSGKTTLLRCLLGLLRPLGGTYAAEGGGFRVGYVPQRDTVDTLYPLTVMDIVLMGRYRLMGPCARPSRVDRVHAESALRHLGIEGLGGKPFRSLSGGQKQRCLIARALVGEPDLVILDEPTNGMDLPSEQAVMELLSRLHREDGLSIILVSHLLQTVINYAGRLALVSNGTVRCGTVSDLVTEAALAETYGIPVAVARAAGRLVVVARGEEAGYK